MDPNNELSHLSYSQLVELAALANRHLQQRGAGHAPGSNVPHSQPYPAAQGSSQVPSYDHGSFIPPDHVNPEFNSEWGGSAASAQPFSLDSPDGNDHDNPVDIEATSPPPKTQAAKKNARTDKRKGKQVANEEDGKRTKQDNYQALEDRLLVTCWLEVSCDPMTNTGQNLEAFWEKITALYNSKRGAYPARTKRSLQSRYDNIKKAVGKFSSYYADVVRRNPSGMTDADKATMACSEYAACEPGHKPFKFMHCWEIMKDNPKFQDTKHGRNYRATQTASYQDQLFNQQPDELGEADTCPTPTTTTAKRPMGRDAAKRMRKKQNAGSTSTAGSDVAQSMHDMMLSRFAQNDNTRQTRQDAFLEWKKEEKEDAKQDRKALLEIEKEKLQLEAKGGNEGEDV